MKTTLELPDDLVHTVKLRALRDGRKWEEAVADLLRIGLAAPASPPPSPSIERSARIITDSVTGLPVIVCDPDAAIIKMSIEEILALEQETQTLEDLERLGLSP